MEGLLVGRNVESRKGGNRAAGIWNSGFRAKVVQSLVTEDVEGQKVCGLLSKACLTHLLADFEDHDRCVEGEVVHALSRTLRLSVDFGANFLDTVQDVDADFYRVFSSESLVLGSKLIKVGLASCQLIV